MLISAQYGFKPVKRQPFDSTVWGFWARLATGEATIALLF